VNKPKGQSQGGCGPEKISISQSDYNRPAKGGQGEKGRKKKSKNEERTVITEMISGWGSKNGNKIMIKKLRKRLRGSNPGYQYRGTNRRVLGACTHMFPWLQRAEKLQRF